MDSDRKILVWSKKLPIEKYLIPGSIAEALEMLKEYPGKAMVMAGGTDVLVGIRKGTIRQRIIVDISKISGLDHITMENGTVRLGALVTHRQVADSEVVRVHARALSQGASAVGSPQIRTMGTVVGNLVSAQPAADAAIPLTALNAEVKTVGLGGDRVIPLREFFVATGQTSLGSGKEIITEVRFKALGQDEGSGFLRLAKRRSLALPVLNAAIVLGVDLGEKHFRYVNISLGPVAPTPFRAYESEALLKGAPIDDRIISQAAEKASHEAEPRSNPLRGTAEYRKELVRTFVRRGIHQALKDIEDRS